VKSRRAKSSAVRRLRPFWIVIVAAAGVFATLGGFAVSWPGFDPQTIAVNGNRTVPADEIVEASGISRQMNMWLQDPRAIAHRIEEIPDIESVGVRRIPPTTIELLVTERKPFAIVRWQGGDVLVDRDLRVLSDPPAIGEFPILIFPLPAASPGAFLDEPQLAALRDDYDALVAAHVVATELRLDRFGGLVARLHGGVTVLFGEGDLEKKIVLVNPILAQVDRGGRRIATIDLRAAATPVVVYK
jgi:cell division septal protein FtsQ